MAILIKCKESHLSPGDEQTFTLQKQKGVGLTRGQEVFIWISELPREGRPLGPAGLRMRGEVTDWEPASSGRTTVNVRIHERLPDGLGMNAFAARGSVDARELHRSINAFRHCRIWGLSLSQRQALSDAFHPIVAVHQSN